MNGVLKPTLRREDLIKINESIYEIPREFRSDMRVPARIFVNEKILDDILTDRSLWQMVNVATLPGLVHYAMSMPDIHEGYGFPIGGVVAMALDQGAVISPGGIGYDINCGVRLLVLDGITAQDIKPSLTKLATQIFDAVPSGVGRGGSMVLSDHELHEVLMGGAQHLLKRGFGNDADIVFCEENGRMAGADATMVSQKAKNRGKDQLGTLGSGNHFIEVQRVSDIFDNHKAQVYGLEADAVTIMIHCGSRGLGHQTCTDYVRTMLPKLNEWGIVLPDQELVCAPFKTQEAQNYFAAMQAAANFAWANRHMIGHHIRTVCSKVFGNTVKVRTIYDVSHNIGKIEQHHLNGKPVELLMHRKGATRSFGPGRIEIPALYQSVGQPVLVPGTMGTASYVMAGMQEGMDVSFGSCCHGAGRTMSRMKAKKEMAGINMRQQLELQGIVVRCDSDNGLAEEAPIAYKDIEEVVDVVYNAKIACKVARLVPLAVIKGG